MTKNRILVMIVSVVFALTLILTGCQTQQEAPTPVPTSTPSAEIVKTVSDITASAVSAEVKVPAFYIEVLINGIASPVYAFTDAAGVTQLRVYGEHSHLANNEVEDTHTCFYAVSVKVAGEDVAEGVNAIGAELKQAKTNDTTAPTEFNVPKYELVFAKDAEPVTDTEDAARQCVPMVVPEGAVIPEGYTAVDGKAGLYSYVNLDGKMVYRVYGAFEGQNAGFWMAAADGAMIPGTFMIDTDMEKALSMFAGTAEPKPANATYVMLNMNGTVVEAMLKTAEAGIDVAVPVEEPTPTPVQNDKAADKGGSSKGNSGSSNGSANNTSGGGSGSNSGGSSGGNTPAPAPDPTPAPPAPTPAPTPEPTPEPTPTREMYAVAVCNTCGFETSSQDAIGEHGKQHMLAGEKFSYYVEERYR